MTPTHEISNEEISKFRKEVEDELAGFELPRSREDFIIETDQTGCKDTTIVRWSRDGVQPDDMNIPASHLGFEVEITYELEELPLSEHRVDKLIRETSEFIIDLHVDDQEVIELTHQRIDESLNQDDDSTYAAYGDGPSGWTTDFDVEATNTGESNDIDT